VKGTTLKVFNVSSVIKLSMSQLKIDMFYIWDNPLFFRSSEAAKKLEASTLTLFCEIGLVELQETINFKFLVVQAFCVIKLP